MVTALTLELTARGDVIGLCASTARTYGLTVRFRPTDCTEQVISLILAHLIDFLKA